MAPTALVDGDRIKLGQGVLAALDGAGIKIRTAFWGRLVESGEWRLFLIMPSVDNEGPRAVYSRIQRVIGKSHVSLPISRITVVGPHDPVAREVRDSLLPAEYGSTSALPMKNISGDLIEQAFVYRSS
jgi:hypothetical protein